MYAQKYQNSDAKKCTVSYLYLCPLMAGIYVHIPFCKQACYYCDFHFSTNQSYRSEMIQCLAHELELQKDYVSEPVSTIYFGGGTPSLLATDELSLLFQSIANNYLISPSPEITLEANPDDLSLEKINTLKKAGINRLSVGIQSFDDRILKFLNRAHNAHDALQCIPRLRQAGFNNISIDIIHSIPGQSNEQLKKNLELTLSFDPEHISAYSLTIEENTVFGKWHKNGKLLAPDENFSAGQFEIVMDVLTGHGYRHYEISNFCKPGFHSRHNSSYWRQETYLGIGPGAHSYNKQSRQYNVANNHQYMKSIREGVIPCQVELLSRENQINEYIFTSLRTEAGCRLDYLSHQFNYNLSTIHAAYLGQLADEKLVEISGQILTLTRKGKLLADQISSDLFISSG
jgi:oxygen-independent coproporphyrinogen-3 oxidase